MATDPTGYPSRWAGEPAAPPRPVTANQLAMARRAQARTMAAEPPRQATGWRLAGSIETARGEANAANPSRDKASDGTVGDARHAAEGQGSDHNPWVIVDGTGVVRALDLDVDGLDLPTAFERARQLAAAGKLPQVTGGGYLILNRRITADDWSGWRAYTGPDPHVTHGHISVSRDRARFDSRAPWGLFAAPAPPAPAGWTGPDLAGRGQTLRGEVGNNGPRVGQLQSFLNRYAPSYAHLAVDGWWGDATTGVVREFGQRSGIGEADGRNIGPKLARALWQAGFDRTTAAQAARARAAVRRARV